MVPNKDLVRLEKIKMHKVVELSKTGLWMSAEQILNQLNTRSEDLFVKIMSRSTACPVNETDRLLEAFDKINAHLKQATFKDLFSQEWLNDQIHEVLEGELKFQQCEENSDKPQ